MDLEIAFIIRCTLGVQMVGGSIPSETTHALMAERYIFTVAGAKPWRSRYPMYLRMVGSRMGSGAMACAWANFKYLFTAAP